VRTPSSAKSYDDIPGFGLLYDGVPAYEGRRDVAFYVEQAARAGGDVLELGCGTGRVLLPMARAGASVTGLDGSREMLDRCRAKLDGEPREVRSRVTLVAGDATGFDLGRTFRLVVAPFRILQQLVTIEEQLGLVTSVARHLAQGGRFVFDVFNPSFAVMATDRSEEREETPTQPLPDGRTLRRAVRIPRVRWTDQVSEIELAYYIADRPGAPERRYVQAFDMRWFVRAELEHLLARAGLRATSVLGDFDGSVLSDGSPEQIVIGEMDAANSHARLTIR
jgi:SAM-dependent methyltransferase